MRRANRSPWFPGIMEEAYRQRYTERDTIDWICCLRAMNKIAIIPHLFPQVNFKIPEFAELVNTFLLIIQILMRIQKTGHRVLQTFGRNATIKLIF